MQRNSYAMRVPVDRFMGMAELRDESRWQDEYETFAQEQSAAIERAHIDTSTVGSFRRKMGRG